MSSQKTQPSKMDELYKYFLTYSAPPTLKLHIEGLHTVDPMIIDFSMIIDLSDYILQPWTQMKTMALENKKRKSVKDTLQEFCSSKNKLKE